MPPDRHGGSKSKDAHYNTDRRDQRRSTATQANHTQSEGPSLTHAGRRHVKDDDSRAIASTNTYISRDAPRQGDYSDYQVSAYPPNSSGSSSEHARTTEVVAATFIRAVPAAGGSGGGTVSGLPDPRDPTRILCTEQDLTTAADILYNRCQQTGGFQSETPFANHTGLSAEASVVAGLQSLELQRVRSVDVIERVIMSSWHEGLRARLATSCSSWIVQWARQRGVKGADLLKFLKWLHGHVETLFWVFVALIALTSKVIGLVSLDSEASDKERAEQWLETIASGLILVGTIVVAYRKRKSKSESDLEDAEEAQTG